MKCNNCGAGLHIEQEICAYCDAPNPYFAKHREDMQAYEEKFKESQAELETHTKKYTKNMATISIICVLLCLNMGILFACTQVRNIGRWIEEKEVSENQNKHQITLETMAENRNYIGLSCYISVHGLSYKDEFRDYSAVRRCAENYEFIFKGLMALNYDENLETSSRDFWIETIAEYMLNLYKIKTPDEYSNMTEYTARHLQTMDEILEQSNALLAGYTDLSLQEIDDLETMSKAAFMLRLEEVFPDEI